MLSIASIVAGFCWETLIMLFGGSMANDPKVTRTNETVRVMALLSIVTFFLEDLV